MNIADLFDARFGLKPKDFCHDPAIRDYCRWLLKGRTGTKPCVERTEDVDFADDWGKRVEALILRAEQLAKAGE